MERLPWFPILGALGTGIFILLTGIFVKAILDAEKFESQRSERAQELFRLFYVGPDLVGLALALLVSSRALEEVLNGHKISNRFGENFSSAFNLMLFFHIFSYFVCVALWKFLSMKERSLRVIEKVQVLQDEKGQPFDQKMWVVNWSESLKSRAGVRVLLCGNFVGLLAIIAYGWFLLYGFVM